MNLNTLFESREPYQQSIDNLEARRIHDLNMKMAELLDRAEEPAYKKNPAALAGLKKEFKKAKDERDSYFKINPQTGMDPTGSIGTVKGKLDEEPGMAEGWSDAMVSRRTGSPRTPYSVYINGKKWKDFKNDDHAEAVANKLKAKFKADGRDPETITIAPTDMSEGTMASAEKHSDGPEFTGYWKGTDSATPGNKMVGSMEEAAEKLPTRNFVVKNMKQSGQGKHKDMKRAEKQGDVKHKAKAIPVDEGEKVDRMVKHIAKSEREAGKSKKDAESIAWATANKRGYLDNANKKDVDEGIAGNMQVRSTPMNLRTPKVPQISKAGKGPHNNALKKAQAKRVAENFVQWAVNEGYSNFTSNPAVYEQARLAYKLNENLTKASTEQLQAIWNSHKDEERPSPALAMKLKAISRELQRRKTQPVDEDLGSLFTSATEAWNIISLIKEYGLPLGLFAAAVGMYGLARAAEYLEQGEDKFAQMAKPALKKVPSSTIHNITDKLNQAFVKVSSSAGSMNPVRSAMDFTEDSYGQVNENYDYMGGHCHIMALALKKAHPDWQIRAHVGWSDDDEAEDDDYRVDHVYVVAPDGSAYDSRGRFNSEEELVGPDNTGGVDTQYVDMDLAEIKRLVQRGELKPFTSQDIAKTTQVINQKQSAPSQDVAEDWQKANKKDKTDGMSQKAVNAYKRENPGSKLKTAVTTKPSKLKKGSKASKRRSSYCSRSKGQQKMHNISCSKTPDKAICKARRRWNCESVEQFEQALYETMEQNKVLAPGEYFVWTVHFDDGTEKQIKVTKDTFDPKAYYAKKNQNVIKVDYSWDVQGG